MQLLLVGQCLPFLALGKLGCGGLGARGNPQYDLSVLSVAGHFWLFGLGRESPFILLTWGLPARLTRLYLA